MTGGEIRKQFLDFFASKSHKILPSSSLTPSNDPTLLFTNAGMVQFKDVFMGREPRPAPSATTCQKCLRVSGKHNDLENVGRTARHHTFFEMLGNFSFGDYFKREAINMAWELLVNRFGLDPERLWITVFRDDDEAEKLWLEETPVKPERILRLGEKDNFWSMGETGPCGPCSEIHFDQGTGIFPCPDPDNCGPDCDCDRFLELWNLVFMQYERATDGTLSPLPKPSIDTGMGLERVTAVIQGKHCNYDSDLFKPIIEFTASLAGLRYGACTENDVSLRVAADHVRAAAFLIADGVTPSNEGRGYVLRRIMRRAMRHGRLLGMHDPFFHKVAEMAVNHMGDCYPDLKEKKSYISNQVLEEEKRFSRTIDRGLQLLEDEVSKLIEAKNKQLSGEAAFKLYDTFGFPLDLTADILRDRGLGVDEDEFNSAMEAQRKQSQDAWTGSGDSVVSQAYLDIAAKGVHSEFTGYRTMENSSKIIALLINGKEVSEAPEGSAVEVILDQCPFYGESGGQAGDRGSLLGDDGLVIRIENSVKPVTSITTLKGELIKGVARTGSEVLAKVEAGERFASAQNHSATHLLQAALRQVLGSHVNQKGSLVAPDRLRFDFSHFAPLEKKQLEEVERLVNGWIQENHAVSAAEESYDEAVSKGVTALFGEKYGDTVRAVRMGCVSAELCGGTHVGHTGDVGTFVVLSETGVAAGVRRIEAAAGMRALEHFRDIRAKLEQVAALTKGKPEDAPTRVQSLLEKIKELEKESSTLRARLAGGVAKDALADAKIINGVKVLAARAPAGDPKALREFADGLRDRMGSGVLALGADADGKVMLLVAVTPDLVDRLKAGQLIRSLAQAVGGNGGGRPDLAQAGGKDPSKLDGALLDFYAAVEAALKK